MSLSPLQLLREAIKAVPALKYALGVVGLVAVVAIVRVFQIRPEIAVLGSVGTLVLMVALLVFAKLTKTAKRHFLLPALVLMWSFLVLVIAAAGFMFSSAFFRWPMDFSLFNHSTSSGPDEFKETVAAARRRLATLDYEGAWKTLADAGALKPRPDAVLDAQVDVAMPWLRNLVVREPRKYTDVVDQLLPPLYDGLAKAKGTRAGDINAHIGWAYFLRSRENPSKVDIDAEFRKALEYDTKNTYAHAFLAHRLLQHTGNVAAARRHFDIALATKRDSQWVRGMQLAGLRWIREPENNLELARVANEMRKGGDELRAEEKSNLFNEVYWFGATFDYLTNLVHSLPASEHLATLEWLAGEKGWEKSWPEQKFVRAELRERTEDWPGALELYQGLASLNSQFQAEVKQAIARCKARRKLAG